MSEGASLVRRAMAHMYDDGDEFRTKGHFEDAVFAEAVAEECFGQEVVNIRRRWYYCVPSWDGLRLHPAEPGARGAGRYTEGDKVVA